MLDLLCDYGCCLYLYLLVARSKIICGYDGSIYYYGSGRILAVAKRDENGNEILIKYMNMDPTNPIFTC